MEKIPRKLIFFMPSMEGGGVEKNLIIIANYISEHIKNIKLITFDNSFNKYFNKKIKIVYVTKKTQKNILSILNTYAVFGFL